MPNMEQMPAYGSHCEIHLVTHPMSASGPIFATLVNYNEIGIIYLWLGKQIFTPWQNVVSIS